MKNTLKSAARRLLVGAAFVAAVLLTCEVYLRVEARLRPKREYLRATSMVNQRLWVEWLAGEQVNPLMPPFTVFSNQGFDDAERMRRVWGYSKLAPNGSWTAWDFIQSRERKEQSKFSATTNSLGFRDPKRSPAKPKGVFRVIALGAYETFGHGLGDSDTYPRQLERMLNKGAGAGRRFEVWNGGKQASTAIMGLARLRHEILDYKPDLLILEYGFVDNSTVGDDFLPFVMRLPSGGGLLNGAKAAFRVFANSAAGHSFVLHRVSLLMLQSNLADCIRRWEEAMKRMIEIAKENGIAVILIDQGVHSPPEEIYRRLASGSPNGRFYSVRRAFESPPSKEQQAEFNARDTWMTEFRTFSKPPTPNPSYYIDIWHPNRQGNEAIARLLEGPVSRLAAGQTPR